MGLLQMLFGGGTKLSLSLDATEIPPGGLLSGKISLQGGKKDLELTSLRLQFVRVDVEVDDGMPDVDIDVLLDEVLASDEALPKRATQEYSFSFAAPDHLEPSGSGTSYQLKASADIPKVKDPSAMVKVKVVEGVERGLFGLGAAKGPAPKPISAILDSYPGLDSDDEQERIDAVWELQSDAYDPEEVNLIAAEPMLARFAREGGLELRKNALEAWGTVLKGRVRKEHLALLRDLATSDGTPEELVETVAEVACMFAQSGAMPIVEQLATRDSAAVRAACVEPDHLAGDGVQMAHREAERAAVHSPGALASAPARVATRLCRRGRSPW